MTSALRGPSGTAVIEPDGQVRLRGLQPGEYTVHVHCTGMLSAERYPPAVLTEASVIGLRWAVTRGQGIRGTVVDGGGRPAAGMTVRASMVPDPSRPEARMTGGMAAPTDQRGSFAMAGLLPGKYRLTATEERQGRMATEQPMVVEVAAGRDLDGVRLSLPAVGEVRGSVRDGQGRGVARVAVTLSGAYARSVQVADDGSFVVPGVFAGEYRIQAMRGGEPMRAPGTGDDDVQGMAVVVRAGAVETVQLVVEAMTGEIRGVVRDGDGGVVHDAFVEASREPESAAALPGEAARNRWRTTTDRPVLTDADGRFTLAGLRPGKYSVRAQRRGGGEGLCEHAVIGEDVVVTLAETGSLAGTVVMAGGEAPEEFEISLRDRSSGFSRWDRFYRTGGEWRLGALVDGDFEIEATAGSGKGRTKVALAPGEEKVGVRVEMTGLVTVRGTVVDLEGAPVAGIAVVIPTGHGFALGETGEHVSDAAGRYVVTQAPVGVVQLMAAPRVGREYQATWTKVTIAGGQDAVELPPIRMVREQVRAGEAIGDLGYTLLRSEPAAEQVAVPCVVAVVRPGGPAARAGLRVGDEIVAVAGQSVIGAGRYLHNNLTRVRPGARVRLGLARGETIEIEAGKLP